MIWANADNALTKEATNTTGRWYSRDHKRTSELSDFEKTKDISI